MKKIFLAVVASAALLFSFNSCAPEDPATAVDVDSVFPKTTLKGVAYLNENTATSDVNGSVATFAPQGTVLSFSISNTALGIIGATGNYVKTAAIGANGEYQVELPARADGAPVIVTISSQTLAVNVTEIDATAGSVNYVRLFELNPAVTVNITKGLVAQKRVDFAVKEELTETADWKNAKYTTTLKYNDGKTDINVPEGTQVVITINKSKFKPARLNDLTYVATVGANGLLTVDLPAPILALVSGNGLDFTMTSSFIANYIDITAGNELTMPYTFNLNDGGRFYGGAENNAAPIFYAKGTKVGDSKAPWKSSKYTVKFLYNKDRTELTKLVGVPTTAKVTITAQRSIVDPKLTDIVKITTYEDFQTNGVTLDAPDPAVSSTPLPIIIEVDFIENVKTGVASGNDVFNQFKYNYTNTNSLWGGIEKKGGSKINDGNGNDVDYAISIPNGSGIQLTFN